MTNTHTQKTRMRHMEFPGKIQNRHLDKSILLKETGSDAAIRSTILIISLVVIGFIVWANFLELSEVASAKGEITHQGDIVAVQDLVGGRVKALFVQNGQSVREGQLLISLDPVISKLERESMEGKRRLLTAKKLRLNALLSGNQPDFSIISDSNIQQAEGLLYDNAVKSYALEKKILESQIDQVVLEMGILKTEEKKLKNSIAFIKEELEIRKKLGQKGLSPKVTLLKMEKEYNEAIFNLKQIPENIQKLQKKKQELGNALDNVTATYMERFSKELESVHAEMAVLDKQITIFDSNISALEIKAPMEGIVHNIRLNSPGQIVRPGDVLLTLIPTDKPLVAKVKISARDIGHVKTGQPATLRITTYDARRYGVLRGTVHTISPSVLIPNDRSEPYYEAIITLEKSHLGDVRSQMKVFSGMTLTADIKTGSKRFIDYLLKPIYLATQTSFHER